MEVTERELWERYRQLDNDALAGLIHDGLTDHAQGVANKVLADRGIFGPSLQEFLARTAPEKKPVAVKEPPKARVGIVQPSAILDGVTELKPDLAKKYMRKMFSGAAWTIGGTLVTALTYAAASESPGGGSYVVAWGAIGWGLFDFIRGLSGWLQHSKSEARTSEPPIPSDKAGQGVRKGF